MECLRGRSKGGEGGRELGSATSLSVCSHLMGCHTSQEDGERAVRSHTFTGVTLPGLVTATPTLEWRRQSRTCEWLVLQAVSSRPSDISACPSDKPTAISGRKWQNSRPLKKGQCALLVCRSCLAAVDHCPFGHNEPVSISRRQASLRPQDQVHSGFGFEFPYLATLAIWGSRLPCAL